MKQFEYAKQHENFDRYRRFTNEVENGFIEFNTGELMYTRRQPDPDQRRMYDKYGVEIVATGDTGLPQMVSEDGQDIPKAWLAHNGIQYLCIDHTKKVVCGLSNWTDVNRRQLPKNIANQCSVYWASSDAMPVGGQVRMWKPAEFTEEQFDYVAILKKLAKAMCALEGITYSSTTEVWTTDQLVQFMAANPDPSAAIQNLPIQVASAIVYAPTTWLKRSCTSVQYLKLK